MGARRRFTYALLLTALPASVLTADAQQGPPPPHTPGTVCYTKYFWCWAQPPGPPGSQCSCPSQYGWVSGVRG